MADKLREWQVPPQAYAENYKLGWLNEHAQDGQGWVKSQRGYTDYIKSFEILAGKQDLTKLAQYRSAISTGRLKRNMKQIRGAVTDIRPISGYTSDNEAFMDNALMMNETAKAIFQEQFLDMALKDAFDWASVTSTAYIHPVFRRDFCGMGEGSLQWDTFGQICVLPTQVPSSGDLQKAYAVTLLDELPIYMAHGLWPKYANRLHPTSSKLWYASEIRTAARGNLLQRMFGSWLRSAGGDSALSDCYVPVRKTWIIDLAINETGETLYMGDWNVDDKNNKYPLNSWSYEVPSLNKPKKNGQIATRADAMIYPNRRLIISSETCVMYDGPAFDWHKELPLIPLCLDRWAFDPVGYSLVRDGYDIQMSINEMERGIMDKNRSQLDMSMAYDINSVSSKEANQFDPMEPRGRIGFDGSLVTQPFVPVMPDAVIQVAPEAFTFLEHLANTMDYQMGVNDLAAMSRAGVIGNEDALNKLLEASGPIVKDITRSVEWTVTGIMRQTKFIIPQYYTVRRIMSYVGPNRVSQQTMDFDPEHLIPSHMPGESPYEDDGKTPKKSVYQLQERARWFAANLRYTIAPHTAHEIMQMSNKLGLVQLRKIGIQISSGTIAQAWNIPNFGGPKKSTEYDTYMAEQMEVAEQAIKVKQMVDAIQQAGVQPSPNMLQAVGTLLGGQPQEGRPTSGEQSPQLVSKEGGARSTISESGS